MGHHGSQTTLRGRENCSISRSTSSSEMHRSCLSNGSAMKSLNPSKSENPPPYAVVVYDSYGGSAEVERNEKSKDNLEIFEEGPSPERAQSIDHSVQPSSRYPPIIIPTRTRQLSSGFSYAQELGRVQISTVEWNNFTQEIIMGTRLSRGEKSLYWGTAVGVGIITGGMFFIFGAIPAYLAGHAVKRRVQEKKALDESVADILERWNEQVFAARGLVVRLAVPHEVVDGTVRMQDRAAERRCPREPTNVNPNRRFRLIIQSI